MYTELTSKVSRASISSSKLDNVPGYIGSVSKMPFVDTRNLRVGLSITRAVSWSPGGIDQTLDAKSLGFGRLNYASSANFQSQLYQAAAGFSPVLDRSLRLGLGVGLAETSYSNNNTVSGTQTSSGQPAQFLETIRAGGTDSALVFTFGAQWDVIGGLTVGAIFRPPGIELWNNSLVTSESSNISATGGTTQYYRDDTGTFRYKLPLMVGVGAVYRFRLIEVEADLRYHNAVSQYNFYQGKLPYQFTDSNNTACSTARSEARRTSDAGPPCTWGSTRRSRRSRTPAPRRSARPTSTRSAAASISRCRTSAPPWARVTSSEPLPDSLPAPAT